MLKAWIEGNNKNEWQNVFTKSALHEVNEKREQNQMMATLICSFYVLNNVVVPFLDFVAIAKMSSKSHFARYQPVEALSLVPGISELPGHGQRLWDFWAIMLFSHSVLLRG